MNEWSIFRLLISGLGLRALCLDPVLI